MNINKEKVEKIALFVLIGAIGLFIYFDLLLGPLSNREAAAATAIASLEPQVRDAKSQLKRTQSLEVGDSNGAAAQKILRVMKASIPEGAPVAWFPQRLSDFFKRQGVAKMTCRFSSETMEPDLPGYKSSNWIIDLPRIEFVPLVIALAGLENQEGLSQITNVKIEALPPPGVQYQVAQVSLSTIVKKTQ
jgi:hypothetical protein